MINRGMNNKIHGFVALAVLTFSSLCMANEGHRVYFVSPQDGAKVKREFTVKFGVEGMAIKPAGVMDAKTGHHHLIIDKGSIPEGEVIPTDDQHLHFGKGQTETKVKLSKGEHKLTLQFADGAHRSYGPAMSSTITVLVK